MITDNGDGTFSIPEIKAAYRGMTWNGYEFEDVPTDVYCKLCGGGEGGHESWCQELT